MKFKKLRWIAFPLFIVTICLFWWCCQQPISTVILIRHAEKGNTPPQDPPLSAAGLARAEALLHVLKDSGVQVVIASQYLRTQQTVQPTAAGLGLVVVEIDAGNTDQIVQLATNTDGAVTLICGHSNTVPVIIEALGGETIADLPEDQFDNLFIVTKRRWHGTKVLHLKYGASS